MIRDPRTELRSLAEETRRTASQGASIDVNSTATQVPDRPTVVKFGPESATPIGYGPRWPGWLLLLALIAFIAFFVWLYAANVPLVR